MTPDDPAQRNDVPQATFRGLVRGIAQILDYEDGAKQNHASRVAYLAWLAACAIELPAASDVYFAALVHDIGGDGLEEHLLHHAERGFTDSTAQSHSMVGADLLRQAPVLAPLAVLVEGHHERVDGGGFPRGLRGEEIPLGASFIAGADTLELALRAVPPSRRRAAWQETLDNARGRIVQDPVAGAFERIGAAPELIDVLFDEHLLAMAHDRIAPAATAAASFSSSEIVDQLVPLMARLVDGRHHLTVGHSIRVSEIAARIARVLGDDVLDLGDVVRAALLHDVGKAALPRGLLAGVATPADRVIFERHTGHGRQLVSSLPGVAHLAQAVGAHHERYDGRGFPDGLAGERIPLIARILAYADRLDWLETRAPGEPARTEAMARLSQEIGTVLDPHLAHAAFAALDEGAVAARPPGRHAGRPAPRSPDSVSQWRPVRGALLLELEDWRRVGVAADFALAGDKGELLELTGERDAFSLFDLIEHGARPQIAEELARLKPGELLTRYIFTPEGRPFEAVLERRADGFSMMYRSAANRLASFGRLAMFYRNFLSSTEAVVFTDPEGCIIDVNRAFLNLFGYQLRDVIGQHTRILRSGRQPEHFYEQMWRSITDPAVGSWSGELIDRRRDGGEVHVAMRISAVRDASGGCVGYIAHHTDISERKRAELEIQLRDEELQRKNAELERLSQFKSEMVAITSHDLKGPLTSIIGVASLLRQNLDRLPRPQIERYLQRIGESATSLVGFINDLLDLERIESGTLRLQYARVLPGALLDRCIELARTAGPSDTTVVRKPGAPERPMAADVRRLEQILLNVLGNAVKFAPRGTVVVAEYSERAPDWVRFTVEDEGPGIPPEQLSAIFDRYHQVGRKGAMPRRGSGSGLGLSIVRQLVSMHDGRVWVENRAPRGCRFVVELPARRDDPVVTHPLALIAADLGPETLELIDRLEANGVSARRADAFVDLVQLAPVIAPDVIFVAASIVPAGGDARLIELVDACQPAPMLIGLDDEDSAGWAFDGSLSTPILENELREVLRRVPSRFGGQGEP